MKVNTSNIPYELKVLPTWCNWFKHPTRGKVPVNPLNGQWAKTNDPETWTTFTHACIGLSKYDGVGFMLHEPYIGIDIDDSLDQTIPSQIQSYTEISPSGNGLRILIKGTIPRAFKKSGLEIYQKVRFITITGNRIETYPLDINNRQKEIDEIIKKEFGNITTSKPIGWEQEAIKSLAPGNICNSTISLAGKLHREGHTPDSIFTILEPHIERAGADKNALIDRIRSITSYPRSTKELLLDEDAEDLDKFLSEIVEMKWIVPNIIPENSITFIYGLQETCKTWIVMDLAIACARGGGSWLQKFSVSSDSSPVLYIDQERSRSETQRRFQALCKAKTLSFKDLRLKVKWGSTIRLNLKQSYDGFRRLLYKIKPKLICVDSFCTFHTAEENNKKDIQEVFEKLKELRNEFGCTFVFIDHENKFGYSPEQKENPSLSTLSGSSGKAAVLESAILVQKEKDGVSKVSVTKNTQGCKVEPFIVCVEDVKPDRSEISVKGY